MASDNEIDGASADRIREVDAIIAERMDRRNREAALERAGFATSD